ncbi:MAG: glycosyltransferase [bacterium]|nr:glycosyltransferase [bacterium]
MKLNNLSVAIITRNREKLLGDCLISLSKQKVIPKEVIVIDNNSKDNTKKVIMSFKKVLPIRYFLEKKIGTAYSRNRALRKSRGKILAFVDDDCIVNSNWTEETIKAHKRYPKAIAIQGKAYSLPKGRIISAICQKEYDRWIKQNIKNNDQIVVLDTKNASFKKERIKRARIFFDSRFSLYCDDLDLSRQIAAKKQIIVYCPEIILYSWWKVSLFGFLKQRFLKGCASALLDYKWSENFRFEKGQKLIFDKKRFYIKKWYAVPIYYITVFLLNDVYRLGYFLQKIKLERSLIFPNSKIS